MADNKIARLKQRFTGFPGEFWIKLAGNQNTVNALIGQLDRGDSDGALALLTAHYQAWFPGGTTTIVGAGNKQPLPASKPVVTATGDKGEKEEEKIVPWRWYPMQTKDGALYYVMYGIDPVFKTLYVADKTEPKMPAKAVTNSEVVHIGKRDFIKWTYEDGTTEIAQHLGLTPTVDTGEMTSAERERFEYQKQQDVIGAERYAQRYAESAEEKRQERAQKWMSDEADRVAAQRKHETDAAQYGAGVMAGARNLAGEQYGREMGVTPEGTVPSSLATSTPRQWVNMWKQWYQPQTAPVGAWTGVAPQVASSAEEARAKGYGWWIPQATWNIATQNINPYQSVYDPSTNKYRPETDAERTYRTQTVPFRDVTRGGGGTTGRGVQGAFDPWGAQYGSQFPIAQWQMQNPAPSSTQMAYADWQVSIGGTGPTGQQLMNAWQEQLALQNAQLGQQIGAPPALIARPNWATDIVGAKWYPKSSPTAEKRWSQGFWGIPGGSVGQGQYGIKPIMPNTLGSLQPSQLQGLQGLVEAAGQTWEDYQQQSRSMWPTAETQGARRRTKVY